jgi:Zn-dependent peptidase ImmA (M78 family)
MPAEIPGCSVRLNDRFLIAYERDTSLFHQQYIIFHEIGHVLFQHDLLQALQVVPLRIALDAAAIQGAMARSGYLEQPEQEAEIFASLLLQRVVPAPIVESSHRTDDLRVKQLQDFILGLG